MLIGSLVFVVAILSAVVFSFFSTVSSEWNVLDLKLLGNEVKD